MSTKMGGLNPRCRSIAFTAATSFVVAVPHPQNPHEKTVSFTCWRIADLARLDVLAVDHRVRLARVVATKRALEIRKLDDRNPGVSAALTGGTVDAQDEILRRGGRRGSGRGRRRRPGLEKGLDLLQLLQDLALPRLECADAQSQVLLGERPADEDEAYEEAAANQSRDRP